MKSAWTDKAGRQYKIDASPSRLYVFSVYRRERLSVFGLFSWWSDWLCCGGFDEERAARNNIEKRLRTPIYE